MHKGASVFWTKMSKNKWPRDHLGEVLRRRKGRSQSMAETRTRGREEGPEVV